MHLPVVPTDENQGRKGRRRTAGLPLPTEHSGEGGRIGFDTADSARQHIAHFIHTVDDADLARQLATLRLAHEGDLRAVLKDLLRQNQRSRRDDARKSRLTKKDEVPRRIMVQPVARKRVAEVTTKVREPPEVDSSGDEPEYSSESDGGMSNVASEDEFASGDDDEGDSPIPKATESTDELTAEAIAKIFAAIKSDKAIRLVQGGDGGRDRRQQPDRRRPEKPCTHCGSLRHQDRDPTRFGSRSVDPRLYFCA
ncbi:hypothetical protein PINS_up008570 [Pythium insidiosum]|nr:hypothetical protein PINS_up008570 [Pythium insidiosum]